MAIGYGSSSMTGLSDALVSSVNVPVPSGVAIGDIICVALEQWESANPAVTMPSGFALLSATVSGSQKLKAFWKRATAADVGNYTFSWTGTQWTVGHAIRITGALAAGDPIGAAFTTGNNTGTTLPALSLIVGFIPGLVVFIANENSATQTPSASYTEVQDSNYLHTNYRLPGASGTYALSGGSLSASTLKLGIQIGIQEAGGGGGSPINVALNRATEMDTAQALTRTKLVGLGKASETDAGRALTRSKSITLGRASELDVGKLLSLSRMVPLARATEVDSSRTITASKLINFGRALELDSSRPLSRSKLLSLSRATETDLARVLTVRKGMSLGRAIENDISRPVSPNTFQVVVLGRAVEIDIAQGLQRAHGIVLPRATEVDTARGLTARKNVLLLRAIETDLARELSTPLLNWPPTISPGQQVELVPLDVSYGAPVLLVRSSEGSTIVTIEATS